MADKWNLEGTPSKAQKALTVVLAIVGSLVCGGFALGIFLMALRSGSFAKNLPAAIFLFALFLACIYVLYRVFFSEAKQISRRGRMVVGVVAVSLSGLMLLVALFSDLPIEKRLFAFSISVIGFGRGVQLVNRNRSQLPEKGSPA